MKSAFYKVTKELRYSLVWEDVHLLYAALEVQPTDKVLVITAAGCNVLNTLLKLPASVTAIDLNPVQNDLLRLKIHVIAHYDYTVFANILGLNGPDAVPAAWKQIAAGLSEAQLQSWEPIMGRCAGGLLTGGKLENYIQGFPATLPAEVQAQLQQFLQFKTVGAQQNFFLTHLDKAPFKPQFIDYFDKVNLSRGRDPALFAYARESGGDLFYERLKAQISTVLMPDNFFFRFFFFGLESLPQNLLPPAYQQVHYEALRNSLSRLKIVQGEAMNYLLSPDGQAISKASLSNIFEYTTVSEFRAVCRQVHRRGTDLRFIFWNLLQEQGGHLTEDGWQDVSIPTQNDSTACFYFQNYRAVQNT
jgi:S-adenosylmethionine-diacylglycerol 3-amino-3-carboxypropyl transferase